MSELRLTMRTLILTVLAVMFAGAGHAAPLNAQDTAELNKISAYLNAITSLQASFVQVGPNGELDQGMVYAKKPGRLRFE